MLLGVAVKEISHPGFFSPIVDTMNVLMSHQVELYSVVRFLEE